ncbi:MAG: type II toxin-antitoxin system prevent-host-death family antitoxin [Thermomonas sp.]|uniref:type II toxin-antitoxin system Phd/YefM family antitoxin n=1 Tax=Thermomonas sp. TaxID=1971895 RepID=UPI0039E6D083
MSKSQFKAKALEYFRQVETDGRPVIVTDHGEPTVEIRAYQPRKHDPLDALRGSLLRFDAPTEPVGADDWDALQ